MPFHVLALGAAIFAGLGTGVGATEIGVADHQTVTDATIGVSLSFSVSPSAIPANQPTPTPVPPQMFGRT